MDIVITPGKLSGSIPVIPSKSQAHRYLICAAFASTPTEILCSETSKDMDATANCLVALGANIQKNRNGYYIVPIRQIPRTASLNCCESGSTLRFLLPIAGALGVDTLFHMEGRLPQRPLSPLWEEMERMGCRLSRPAANTIRCQGRLNPGCYTIAGNISSQFITGLLFALPLIDGKTQLEITGNLESKPYVTMTQRAMEMFHYPRRPSPGNAAVEGDWSNGAFWLAARELGSALSVSNLDPDSPQGDRACAGWLPKLRQNCTISAADIPDLVPILSVVAAASQGATFTGIRRLRLKESDRVQAVIDMIRSLGGIADATEHTLTIYGTGLTGGTVDCVNDHRIAMSAAIASTICTKPVTLLGAQCVSKSYPRFWEEFARLGGKYELNLR